MGFISIHHDQTWVIIPTLMIYRDVECSCCDNKSISVMIAWGSWSVGILFEA